MSKLGKSKVGVNKIMVSYKKGGEYRKWYGNYDYVINWSIEGKRSL
ncbi:MAG: hypothetical protein IPJ75_01665 [Ignavibacteriales bacterium]|nr:hypothetical protein [Ignavibacteriales bacterium]